MRQRCSSHFAGWNLMWATDDYNRMYICDDHDEDLPEEIKRLQGTLGWAVIEPANVQKLQIEEITIPYDSRAPIVGSGCFEYDVVDDAHDEIYHIPNETIKRICISEGILYLCTSAFYGLCVLQHVILPRTLRYIGAGSFCDTGLKQISIPDSVRYIGSRCFEGCKHLEECRLPNHIDKIRASTFENCYSLRQIALPTNLQAIETDAFRSSGITMVSFPEGLRTIQSGAFVECESLFSVMLPRSLTSIAANAFDSPEVNPLLTFYVYSGSYGLMWAREHGYKVLSAEI